MAEALGRETPASRYSPAIELHPVLGAARGGDGEPLMGGWSAE
jgi:betaine-homocysteine S-methyltransferase